MVSLRRLESVRQILKYGGQQRKISQREKLYTWDLLLPMQFPGKGASLVQTSTGVL